MTQQDIAPVTEPLRFLILFADDERSILGALVRGINSKWAITVASDGGSAMALLCSSIPFDAVFIDVIMPDKNGIDLYNHCARVAPNRLKRWIWMTAGFDHPVIEPFLHKTGCLILPKPVDLKTIEMVADQYAKLDAPRGP